MNRLVAGLILSAVGLWGAVSWWWFLVDVIKAITVVGLFGAGLILIGLGIKSLTSPATESGKTSE